jgi:hypothetical protein
VEDDDGVTGAVIFIIKFQLGWRLEVVRKWLVDGY